MESEKIEKEEFLAYDDGYQGGVRHGFVFAGFKSLFSLEKSSNPVGERELDRIENGDPFAGCFEMIFEERELSGFPGSVHTGERNDLHTPKRSKKRPCRQSERKKPLALGERLRLVVQLFAAFSAANL